MRVINTHPRTDSSPGTVMSHAGTFGQLSYAPVASPALDTRNRGLSDPVYTPGVLGLSAAFGIDRKDTARNRAIRSSERI